METTKTENKKTGYYHRGNQFNDYRQSIGMPWDVLSKQSGIAVEELKALKEQGRN